MCVKVPTFSAPAPLAATPFHLTPCCQLRTDNVTWPTGLPLMRRLQSGADGVKVLVYNGETDPSVSSVRSQRWTFELNFPVKEAWRPWTFGGNSSDIAAGSIVQWEGDFSHATIRGSGHMVPGFKPYPAYLLLKNFMEQQSP